MNDRLVGLQAFTSLKEIYALAKDYPEKNLEQMYDALNEICGEVELHFDVDDNWRPIP